MASEVMERQDEISSISVALVALTNGVCGTATLSKCARRALAATCRVDVALAMRRVCDDALSSALTPSAPYPGSPGPMS